MPILTPERSLMYLRKTPVILKALLGDVSQERARRATDGPDGWSVIEVMCHLRDYEEIFYQRARMMLESDNPKMPAYDQVEMARARNYASQNLREAFDDYLKTRQRFVQLLEGLNAEQWQRRGIHSQWGDITIIELATNTALHDLNHTEQIVRALGIVTALV
jgi:hypothetical protein